MRIIHLVLPLSVSSFVVTAVIMVACGGSSSNPPSSNGNGNDAGAPSGDSGNNNNNNSDDAGPQNNNPDSGNGNGNQDSGGGNGTFDAADIPDGGLPVTPNQIACGATADCNNTTNTCCIQLDGGAQCIDGADASCPSDTATIHCLEAADCPGGQVCCGSYSATALTATSACQVGPCSTVQFCRTNGECENHQSCVPQTCDGEKLELCGLFSLGTFVQCTAD